jgi:hypothetical protein
MLIITNLVEHTKQHLPSILIKNQVQDNSQKKLVILNGNPSKLMQSNAIVINKVIWTRTRTHLPLTKVVMLLRIFTFTLFQALEPRSFYSSIIEHKTYKATSTTKNNTPIKRKL